MEDSRWGGRGDGEEGEREMKKVRTVCISGMPISHLRDDLATRLPRRSR